MTQELIVRTPKEINAAGILVLRELMSMVKNRPEKEKLIVNGKQYLYFYDWQFLGAPFGITARVTETREITQEIPFKDGNGTMIKVIGFHARAVALKNGEEISAAEAECLFEEPNWEKKPRFQLLSMAETRACSKALRNCLQWIVHLPASKFSDEVAEESQQTLLQRG